MPVLLDKSSVHIDVVRAACCLHDFSEFVKRFWHTVPGAGTLVWNWHLGTFCEYLQEAAERVFLNLPREYDIVCNVSPGTSKSTIHSILFPAWLWTRMPSCRVMTASHTDSLALDLANKARQVIKSDQYCSYFPNIVLREDQDTKGYYRNTLGGDRYTCTVGGKSPMGFHASILVIDDPLDPKKVLSEVELKAAEDFISNVITTRKVDKAVAVTILVMQRLGMGDSTDVMLANGKREGAFPVKHICLPAELEKDKHGAWITKEVVPEELAENYTDGMMDPLRLGRRVLDDYKSRGALFYATQFLQKPYSREGGMFKEIYFSRRCKASPHDCIRIRYWDRACLVAGTMVDTDCGLVSIEDIQIGDKVLTRQGYKEVTWSGETKKVNELIEVIFSNGAVIRGTADHLVWTENRGWIELASLCSSDYIRSSCDTTKGMLQWENEKDRQDYLIPKLSSSIKLHIDDDPESNTTLLIGGIKRIKEYTPNPCIKRYGDFTEVLFQKDTLSITRTRTEITTTFRICNVLLERNMQQSIWKRSVILDRLLIQSIVRRYKRHYLSGLMKIEELISSGNNVVSEEKHHGRMQNVEDTNVKNAASFAQHETLVKKLRLDTVVKSVLERLDYVETKKIDYVSLVKRDLRPILVHPVAQKVVQLSGIIPVYDLTVKDAHEFFANGILVHNSTQAGGCNTAGVLMARGRDGAYYVENVVLGQWEPIERNRIMRATALRDRSRYGPGNEPRIWVEREGGSSGRDAWLHIVKALEGFPVFEDAVSGDKETRAEPWSAQLAGGNVFIVDNGESTGTGVATWDINGYIQEHCQFPGRYKDQVDSSSGAFNLLNNKPTNFTFRVHDFKKRKQDKGIRIVIATESELLLFTLDERCLLVRIADPGLNGEIDHALDKLMDKLTVNGADIVPSEMQERWEEVLEPYGKKPEELLFTPNEGKRLWSFLTRTRMQQPEAIVFVDNGDRRALSAAMAVADVLHRPRETLLVVSKPDDNNSGDAPNKHVYDVVRAARSMVM